MFQPKCSDQKCVNGWPKGQCPVVGSQKVIVVIVVIVVIAWDMRYHQQKHLIVLNYYVSGKFQFTHFLSVGQHLILVNINTFDRIRKKISQYCCIERLKEHILKGFTVEKYIYINWKFTIGQLPIIVLLFFFCHV